MLDRDLEHPDITRYNRTGEPPRYDYTRDDVHEVGDDEYIRILQARNAEKGNVE